MRDQEEKSLMRDDFLRFGPGLPRPWLAAKIRDRMRFWERLHDDLNDWQDKNYHPPRLYPCSIIRGRWCEEMFGTAFSSFSFVSYWLLKTFVLSLYARTLPC